MPTAAGEPHERAGSPLRAGGRTGTRFRRLGGRAWSQEVETSAAALRMQVRVVRECPPPPGVCERARDVICEEVDRLVDEALRAARGEEPQYRTFRTWWRGTSIEAAFRRLHLAESQVVTLLPDHQVEAEIPVAVARADVALSTEDPLHESCRLLPAMPHGPARRALLGKVVQMSHEAADDAHARVRNFRNVLLSTATCITVLLLVFAVFVASQPTSVPLCFEPQAPSGVPAPSPDVVACPTGDGPGQAPAPMDAVVVGLLGLLGGSLAAAVSIRNLRGTSTPYDIPVALALLKVPAGALTAIGALIAIRGNFVPGLSALDTQEQILAYALVFGYAQQLLTGLIDKRALGLLETVPSKDAQQTRPPLTHSPLPPPPPPPGAATRTPRRPGARAGRTEPAPQPDGGRVVP